MSRDEAGVIAIVVALFAVVLFGFAALVVDVGSAADVKAQAAAAADAGALAGSRDLATWVNANGPTPDPNLEDAVTKAVALNLHYQGQGWASCKDPSKPADFTASSSTECIQYRIVTGDDGLTKTTTVRVRIPTRKVQATFGGIFGVGSISVSPVAAAQAGQDPGSPCEPCDPRLDNSTGQPVSQASLPAAVRAKLPEPPSLVDPAGPTDQNGCPTTPGRFEDDVIVTGPCVLQPGVYLFDNHTLEVHGPLSSMTAADGTGVTLIFYVDDQSARIPLDVDTDFSIIATPPGADTIPGQPIPGVAIVIDQVGTADISHSFELGPRFDITGSIYALDGDTTWRTESGDCPVGGNTCWVHDQTTRSVLSVTKTAFADNTRTPTVHADHPAQLPPPRPTHLVE